MLEQLIAAVMAVSLTVYALSGGADFGGGVWDLLATGPRARRQRDAIAHAIGPIWEANHVWLIVVVVLTFSAFPRAFAVIGTALHIPLTLMLIGIVLRGSAFVFRSYDGGEGQRRWSRLFAVASVITPIMLGVCAGAVASEAIRIDGASGQVTTGFIDAWLAPFPFAIGGMTLTLFAFLGAVYLTVELEGEADLVEDFRRRALGAAVALGILAGVAFLLAEEGAPAIRHGLSGRAWSLPFQGVTGLTAVGAMAALWLRRFKAARVLAMAQVTLILWGWLLAQYPWIVPPDLTFDDAAAEEAVLRPILITLGVGAVALVPSFAYLYRVFKGRPAPGS